MTGGDNEAAVAAVLDLVAQRCRAISEQDWDALAALLADELTHTHITGVTQDKPTYLEHVRKNPRWTERPDLKVRVYRGCRCRHRAPDQRRRGGRSDDRGHDRESPGVGAQRRFVAVGRLRIIRPAPPLTAERPRGPAPSHRCRAACR
jgi:hypothetical protein